MKKFVVFLGLVLLLAAVVGLAVPSVIGGIAERQMGAIVSRMTQNGNIQIMRTAFQRGLFSSTAIYKITFSSWDGKKQLVIPMRSVIHHGLFAGTLYKVTITSTPVLSSEYKKKLAPMFGDKPPFTIVATRGNAGGWKIAFHSPSFAVMEKGHRQKWGGIEAQETIHGNKLAFKANMPGGKFSGTCTDVAIGDVRMSAQGEIPPEGSALANSTMDMSVASLSIINTMAGGKDRSGVITGLRLHERLVPGAAGTLSYGAELSAADLKIGQKVHAANPKLDIRLDGIDRAAVEAVSASVKALKRKHLKPEDLQKQLLAAWNAQLPKFLARSPKATVAFDAGTLAVQADKAGEGPLFVADGFHASEQFQADSNETLTYGVEVSADTLKAHSGVQVTQAKAGLSLANLYWGFLEEVVPQMEALETQHLDPAELQQRERVLLAMYLPDILSHSPDLRLTALEFSGKSGTLKGDGEAKFDGSGNLNLGDKTALSKRINAHLELVADAPLARNIAFAVLTARAKKTARISGKAPLPVSAKMAEGMLDNLQQRGLLLNDGEQYGVRADLKDADIYVNGTLVADLGKLGKH